MTRRPIALTIVLALLAAGNLFGLTWGLTNAVPLQAQYPRLAPALWYLCIARIPVALGLVLAFAWPVRHAFQ